MGEAVTEMGEQPTLAATLDSICTNAVTSLAVDACGIFLVQRGRANVVALAGRGVEQVEHAQLETDQGPCLDAIATAASVVVDDLYTEPRWPTWTAQMVNLGWSSALSLPLLEDGSTIGSLNLFSCDAAAFATPEVEVASLFARHASLALASSRTETSLAEAIDARHRIGLAQGILIERHGLSVEDSFTLLRRYSQDGNLKIHNVAAHLLETGQLPALPVPKNRRHSG